MQNTPPTPSSESRKIVSERLIWQGKIGPAFWTLASAISLAVNLILILVIILLGQNLFTIKKLLVNQLISGLHTNFEQMDQAHIVTTIQVQDTIQVVDEIPVVFDLPLRQTTRVITTSDTPVKKATVFLNGAAVPTDIILRKGTALNIALDLTVPVSQTVPVVLDVPVNLSVPVDIALANTDLHQPFVGLQEVVSPYQELLGDLPDGWEDTPICEPTFLGWFCGFFLGVQ